MRQLILRPLAIIGFLFMGAALAVAALAFLVLFMLPGVRELLHFLIRKLLGAMFKSQPQSGFVYSNFNFSTGAPPMRDVSPAHEIIDAQLISSSQEHSP